MAVETRLSATFRTLVTYDAAAPNQHGGRPCRLLGLTFVRYRGSSLERRSLDFSQSRAFLRRGVFFFTEEAISGHFFVPFSLCPFNAGFVDR